jgi:peptidyl-prolyl cis-trans isomerase A (cyclophilin A)
MLKRALLILAFLVPAFAFAQTGTAPAKPAAKAPAKAAAPAKKAAEPAVSEADKTASKVLIKTNLGDMTVELYPDKAPKTVENFLAYVNAKFYDGTIFHRVIDNFMIQGGCPLGTGTGGPGYTFKDEFHPELAFTKPYLLAMANAGPGTNGSQFFITTAATTWLNNKHTIFGEVADQESRDVVDAIGTTATGPGDRPIDPVVIESVEITRG